MLDTFDAVRLEMLTSIGQLDGAKQDFTVILFADGPPVEPVDRRLVPATTEFKRAARAQADALGARDHQTVMVAHPIQPLTRDEVRALADKAYDEIVARLTRAQQ
jgi:hypothetical protein